MDSLNFLGVTCCVSDGMSGLSEDDTKLAQAAPVLRIGLGKEGGDIVRCRGWTHAHSAEESMLKTLFAAMLFEGRLSLPDFHIIACENQGGVRLTVVIDTTDPAPPGRPLNRRPRRVGGRQRGGGTRWCSRSLIVQRWVDIPLLSSGSAARRLSW
jgi:hypothetical protein